MQAITLAIGKNGITFFAQHYLADALSALLGKMTPPDKSVPVPNFTGGVVGDSYDYSNIKIKLTGGSLRNFSAALNKVVQGVGKTTREMFLLTLTRKWNPAPHPMSRTVDPDQSVRPASASMLAHTSPARSVARFSIS